MQKRAIRHADMLDMLVLGLCQAAARCARSGPLLSLCMSLEAPCWPMGQRPESGMLLICLSLRVSRHVRLVACHASQAVHVHVQVYAARLMSRYLIQVSEQRNCASCILATVRGNLVFASMGDKRWLVWHACDWCCSDFAMLSPVQSA